MPITFGTEGWRAVMAETFTFDNVRTVTQAVAEHVHASAKRRRGLTMAVGYDTRFLSEAFARAVCEVLAGNRIRCVLTDRAVPTCAVSRIVVDKHLPAGMMVTASHNPPIYNGLKVKESYGSSATTESVASIERRLGRSRVARLAFDDARQAGLVVRENFMPTFLKGIREYVDLPAIRRANITVIVDSMHGTGGRIVEGLLAGGRCRVTTLHGEPDPLFGGQAPEPIPSHLGPLARAVARTRAHVGLANDGDADRIGLIGPGGTWLNPGQVMCVILEHLVMSRRMRGAVVKTVSNTMMINRMADALGLRLIEVPVGFKYVAKHMLTDDIVIGGEESGGIGVKGYLPERDGLLNDLLVLEAMAVRRQTLAAIMQELERRYGRWFYGRRDLHMKLEQVDALFAQLYRAPPSRLAGVPVARINTLDGVKLIARDDSWLLFRRSGTEPIVRIYAETPVRRNLPTLLNAGVRMTR